MLQQKKQQKCIGLPCTFWHNREFNILKSFYPDSFGLSRGSCIIIRNFTGNFSNVFIRRETQTVSPDGPGNERNAAGLDRKLFEKRRRKFAFCTGDVICHLDPALAGQLRRKNETAIVGLSENSRPMILLRFKPAEELLQVLRLQALQITDAAETVAKVHGRSDIMPQPAVTTDYITTIGLKDFLDKFSEMFETVKMPQKKFFEPGYDHR